MEHGIFAVWHGLRLLPALPVSIWHNGHLWEGNKQRVNIPRARTGPSCRGRRLAQPLVWMAELKDPAEPVLTGAWGHLTLLPVR